MPENVVKEIVARGFCVGCGVCAALCPRENLAITLNDFGEYQSVDSGRCLDDCDLCLAVCPRYYKNANQYEIAKKQFGEINDIQVDDNAGYFIGCFSGHVKDRRLRNQAASGGLCTAFLEGLLASGEVDGVICVRPSADTARLFEFFVATTGAQLFQAAGSVYYPVEMSEVLRKILKRKEARYAVVGLPCFLTAITLAQKKSPKLNRIIKYKIGLVCGSLPNRKFYENILNGLGLPVGSISNIKFRDTNVYANRLRGMRFTDLQGKEYLTFNAHEGKTRRSARFIYTACLLCSDIFAETADAVLMDAWLPEHRQDQFGTSLMLVRNNELMEYGTGNGRTWTAEMEETTIEKIINSQKPRIQNKRFRLLARLQLCKKWGVPYPENIHVAGKKCPDKKDVEKESLKFAGHLRSHGVLVRNKWSLLLVRVLLGNIFKDMKADIKDVVRKYYFGYKYSKTETPPQLKHD